MLKRDETGILIGDTGRQLNEPKTVYRIEMPNGRGPFDSGLPEDNFIYNRLNALGCCKPAERNMEQMGVTEDKFFQAHNDASYACDSLENLRTWFPDEARSFLWNFGAQLVEYEVPAGGHVLETGAAGEVIIAKPECHQVKKSSLMVE